MTTQQAYEAIREYFSRPGARLAVNEHWSCCYRATPDGAKCAVGCLIPDSLYEEAFESNPVTALVHKNENLKELLNGDSLEGQIKLEFLMEAQSLHDDSAGQGGTDSEQVTAFLVGLDQIADEFSLRH